MGVVEVDEGEGGEKHISYKNLQGGGEVGVLQHLT